MSPQQVKTERASSEEGSQDTTEDEATTGCSGRDFRNFTGEGNYYRHTYKSPVCLSSLCGLPFTIPPQLNTHFLTMLGSLGLLQEIFAGRDWGQEEEGTTEDEMAGWHH